MTDLTSTPVAARPQGMLCPVCKVDLVLADRQGIEIDYCPQCRGIWLDRGELDKIIERNESYEVGKSAQGYPPSEPWPTEHGQGRHGGRHGGGHRDDRHGGYRPGGFLGGLFRH